MFKSIGINIIMKNKDLYDQLDVAPDATDEEIKAAYKKKSSKLHPDKQNGDESKFKEMKLAYEVLKDPDSREYYDKHGDVKGNQPNPEQQAISKILSYVNAWLLSGNPNSDLIEFVKNKLLNENLSIAGHIEKATESKKKIEKIKDRITCKKDNFILGFFNANIRDINKHIKSGEEQIDVLVNAIEMMDDFSWEMIEEMNSYVTINTATGTSWG